MLCFWALTSYLMFSQAVVIRSRPLLLVGTAALVVALLCIPNLLAFPGVVTERGLFAGTETAAWIWWLSQVAFIFFILTYVRSLQIHQRPWRKGEGRRYASLGALLALALTIVAVSPGFLPQMMQGDALAAANRSGLSLVLVLGYLATLAYAAAITRGRSIMNLWLLVALLALTLDVISSSVGGMRYTLGWYVGRFDRLFASGSLLVVFLLDFTLTSRRFATLAGLDVVSGLSNRRALDEWLAVHLGIRRRRGDALSMLMLDIDHFKAFNDRYGHATGDACLRMVGDIIRHALVRPTDFAARYGGEEFVVVLPSTERQGAIVVAERIRQDVERIAPGTPKSAPGITVSVGVVTVPSNEICTSERALRAADRALYAAKAAGRNCIAESTTDGVISPTTPRATVRVMSPSA